MLKMFVIGFIIKFISTSEHVLIIPSMADAQYIVFFRSKLCPFSIIIINFLSNIWVAMFDETTRNAMHDLFC